MSDETTTPAAAKLERVGPTAVLTLDRPEHGNALNRAMQEIINQSLQECEDDDAVRVVVLTGAGRMFCAGADLSAGGDTFGSSSEFRGISGRGLAPFRMSKPVIAAMNGHAVGVGMTLAMQCDIRIVAKEAKLGFVFVRRGIVAEAYGHWTVPRVIGLGRAAELFFTGRIFSGVEAAELGIANRAVDAAEVLPTALALAEEIAREASPAAVATSKRLLWDTANAEPEVVYDAEAAAIRTLGAGPDAREGITAFFEKRAPEWKTTSHS